MAPRELIHNAIYPPPLEIILNTQNWGLKGIIRGVHWSCREVCHNPIPATSNSAGSCRQWMPAKPKHSWRRMLQCFRTTRSEEFISFIFDFRELFFESIYNTTARCTYCNSKCKSIAAVIIRVLDMNLIKVVDMWLPDIDFSVFLDILHTRNNSDVAASGRYEVSRWYASNLPWLGW